MILYNYIIYNQYLLLQSVSVNSDNSLYLNLNIIFKKMIQGHPPLKLLINSEFDSLFMTPRKPFFGLRHFVTEGNFFGRRQFLCQRLFFAEGHFLPKAFFFADPPACRRHRCRWEGGRLEGTSGLVYMYNTQHYVA